MSDYLKVSREESGLSQEEVAEALRISRQTLSNWENGKTDPDTKSLAALAKLYGKTVDALLHGDPAEASEVQPEKVSEEKPEEAPEVQKNALSPKTRALLLTLAVLLGLVLSFAAGWYACDYARLHTVNEMQVDLSEPHQTFELSPLEND